MVLKKFNNDVMSVNYGVIINFPVYTQYGAIQKPDFEFKVHNSNFLINKNISSNNLTHSSHTKFLKKKLFVTFLPKTLTFFAKNMLTSAELKRFWYHKVYFLELHICVYLCAKFKIYRIIYRQRVVLPPPSRNEFLKRQLILWLTHMSTSSQI